jgi:hypothetical protein
MSPWAKWSVGTLLVCTAATGAAVLTPVGPDNLLGKGWLVPGESRALQDEVRRGRRLDAQLQEMWEVLAAKQRLVADVIAGRLTLDQAAERCRELNHQKTVFCEHVHSHAFPGRTEHQRHAREVIELVRAALEDQPEGAAAVLSRLEAEFAGSADDAAPESAPPCSRFEWHARAAADIPGRR